MSSFYSFAQDIFSLPFRSANQDDEAGGSRIVGRDDGQHRGQIHRHVTGQEAQDLHGVDQATYLNYGTIAFIKEHLGSQ